MITDSQTDNLFLTDALFSKFPEFVGQLQARLKALDVNYDVLPNTKDIWCRDYMPIQIAKDRFVQFRYAPRYLDSEDWLSGNTRVEAVLREPKITISKSDIILDGGNVVKAEDKVIITDRVFDENKAITKSELIRTLHELLEVEDVVIIPHQPFDLFGHADGMIRFIDSDTVLVNDFKNEKEYFRRNLKSKLKKHGLDVVPFIYEPSSEINKDGVPSAKGTYINYLHVGNKIILPTFNKKEDNMAWIQLNEIYPSHEIETLNCESIASEGGVLNCIGWNVEYWKLILEDFGDFWLVKN